MPPLVSILLPARDAAATIHAAIGSCLAQTFENFELVAVDDGSTDATPKTIAAAARRDRRVRALRLRKPGGLIAALQAAHRAARGRLLARMDADDIAHPERLAEQVAYLDEHRDVAVVGCRVRVTDVDGVAPPRGGFSRYQSWLNRLQTPEEHAAERFIESPLAHPSVVMRREAFESVGGYRDPGWPEDYDLWLRMFDAGMRVAKVPRALLTWRDRPDRLSRIDPRYARRQFQRAKAHYLARVASVRRRGVAISGGGANGKAMARLLAAEGVRVHALYDVSPRRIGRALEDGTPILDAEAMPEAARGAPIQLAAVAQPGGREAIREIATAHGYREGKDFFCVA